MSDLVCAYCGTPQSGKLGCCGETHFIDSSESDGLSGIIGKDEVIALINKPSHLRNGPDIVRVNKIIEWLFWDRERLIAESIARSNELNECAAALPGSLYMDPPDGGDTPISEQLRRMAKDAALWRALATYNEPGLSPTTE